MPRPNDVGVGTAIFILNEKGQILLMKRKGAHAAGTWQVPGGWVDRENKTLFSAIAREAAEETGLTIWKAAQVGTSTEDHKDLGARSVTVYFVSHPNQWEGEPTILEPHKAAELEWFYLNSLPSPLFPALDEGIFLLREHLANWRLAAPIFYGAGNQIFY